jgi:hypothetical protein
MIEPGVARANDDRSSPLPIMPTYVLATLIVKAADVQIIATKCRDLVYNDESSDGGAGSVSDTTSARNEKQSFDSLSLSKPFPLFGIRFTNMLQRSVSRTQSSTTRWPGYVESLRDWSCLDAS